MDNLLFKVGIIWQQKLRFHPSIKGEKLRNYGAFLKFSASLKMSSGTKNKFFTQNNKKQNQNWKSNYKKSKKSPTAYIKVNNFE